MKTKLEFKTISYDIRRISNTLPVHFFKLHKGVNSESVLEYNETPLIHFFLSRDSAKKLFSQELGLNIYYRYFPNMMEPIIVDRDKIPGDIDILIVQPCFPHKAIAIECKRIKIKTFDNKGNKINKINIIKKGIKQANALREMGFFQSYLAIFIEVDSRKHLAKNFLFRNSSLETLSKIYNITWNGKLHKDVGIVFVEISQPTDRDISFAGTIGICVDKRAAPQMQHGNLTNRINEFLKNKKVKE